MSTRYRVTVEQIEDVDGAQYETREIVLFEATSPSMDRLAAFAPVEVLAALGGVAGSLRVEVAPTAEEESAEPSPAEANREAMLRDEAAEAAKPKRVRRTKAQIAADEAAARQVAEVVVSNDQAVAQVGEAADTVAEQVVAQKLGYMTPDGPVVEDAEPSGVMSTPSPDAVVLAAVPPAAPFNPFLR